jgi:pimeloyl-ACP methyl ester carboxylesterase
MPKVRAGDTDIYFEDAGEGEEPLLLLHGLGQSGRVWEQQVNDFAPHFRVIIPDLRGHGQSDHPRGPYSIALFAEDMLHLLAALKVPQAHVLGFSLGGMVGFQMAHEYPERVRSLVVVNSGPSIKFNLVNLVSYARGRINVHFGSMAGLGRQMLNLVRHKEYQAAFAEILKQRWGDNNRASMMASIRAFQGWSVEDKLAEIECPVLAIASDADYTPIAYKERYVEQLPDARLVVIHDSHHRLLSDSHQQFNVVVRAFLGQVQEGTTKRLD